jgi:UDP-N-acetylmuramoyl-tripeptide--D-alanyl-D-alanine ligase
MRGAGQIAYLAKVAEPTIGVITNIGPQHIEQLGSVENIARAKAELVQNLPPDGVAILPADGENASLLRELALCRVVTFGSDENSNFRVSSTRSLSNGHVEAEFEIEDKLLKIVLPMPGVHNAINAAAALAVANELNVTLQDAAQALQNVEVPGARMRLLQLGDITLLDDSYNAGPNSMRAALHTLRDFPDAHRRVAILGTMKELGAWSKDEHREIVRLANSCADVLIGVGEECARRLQSRTSKTTSALMRQKPPIEYSIGFRAATCC